MSDTTHDLLKQVSAELERASSAFSKQAEEAMNEARKAGGLSEQTKATVDELALKFNSLTEAEIQLKTRLGEIEQEFARLPSPTAIAPQDSLGTSVVKSEALKAFAASVEGGKRISIPVNAALLSTDIPAGVIEPMRLPGIDALPKQRLFIRDLIAPVRSQCRRSVCRLTSMRGAAARCPSHPRRAPSNLHSRWARRLKTPYAKSSARNNGKTAYWIQLGGAKWRPLFGRCAWAHPGRSSSACRPMNLVTATCR
ncbi:hypothetical protein ACW9IO_23935 [Pseudomonas azotoformans]